MTSTAPTSTAAAHTALGATSLWVNSVDKGKFELVLGNATATTSAGGQYGQLALYSAGTKGTYLDAAANSTDWYTATLQAKTGTIALTSDIPTNLNQLTNGPGYVTSSGVTSITLSAGAGISLSATGAITSTGTRTISISGVDTSSGSETQCLTKKGTWKTFGTSNLALGTTAGAALAASGSAGSATTAAKSDHVHPFPTAENVGAATSDHVHGNITNAGGITSDALTIANNDFIVIGDSSNSGKLHKGPAFNASTTTKCLTQKGTWASFTNNAGTVTSITLSAGAGIALDATEAITSSGTRTISIDGMDESSGSTTKCLTQKGTWASFTNNAGTVTSITLSAGAGIALSATGAITTSGTRTISIDGMNESSGSTSKCLTQKGTWASFTNNAGTVTSVTIKGGTNIDVDSESAITGSGTRTISLSSVQNPLIAASSTAAVTSSPYKSSRWAFNLGVAAADLTTGMMITVKIPQPTNTYGSYVSIDNGTTYKPIAVGTGKGRMTTHYAQNNIITLFYDSAGTVTTYAFNGAASTSDVTGGCWRVLNYYDSGNTTTTVRQSLDTTNKNRPLILAYDDNTITTVNRDYQTYRCNAIYANPSTGHLYATAVHNAVWNDYAEYRKAAGNPEPGRVVIDNDNGTMTLATQRLMPGAQVVSDTWGHVMGETEDAKTPIAVAGRVLVYTFQNRENYHAGMAVCSAPDGTVDIMTREEIRDYPDCIVGIVSEIPDYEEWGSGNVKVNGRIWIRVK